MTSFSIYENLYAVVGTKLLNPLKRQGGRHQEADWGMFPRGKWTSFESYKENCIKRRHDRSERANDYYIFKPEVPWMCALAAFDVCSMN